ncbi:hypothetical protein [Ahrensia sp. R2A130]|uniref:hypothetical protein n=1 Tax=Ahrensia sp. R2A130 TaxID=744979 RepID=UPI0001E08BF3|nr:hypothetical protein [Ahrensia sp. R2A130]EFL89955.1 conserved hypothetical protein [Ahrensia sp. R2A130]
MFRIAALALMSVMFLFTAPQEAQAGIPYTFGSHVSKVSDLPEMDALKRDGEMMTLGFEHDYYSVAFIPLWGSTEGRYVLYTYSGRSTSYVPLPAEMEPAIAQLLGKQSLEPQPFSKLSMIWGSFILGPLVLIGLAKQANENRRQKSGETGEYSAAEMAAYRAAAAHHPATQNPAAASSPPRPAGGGFGKRR